MSVKNLPLNKKVRAMQRALRKGRIPAYLDLVHWLEDHGHADSTGSAMRLILDKRVKSESHVLGFTIIENDKGQKEQVLQRRIPARLRPTIHVVAAEA